MRRIAWIVLLIVAVGVVHAEKVEVIREVVTNSTPPVHNVNYITDSEWITTTAWTVESQPKWMSEERCNERLQERYDEGVAAGRKELTYPKESTEQLYVWSNTTYNIMRRREVVASFSSNVCFRSIERTTTINQTLSTNVVDECKEIQ